MGRPPTRLGNLLERFGDRPPLMRSDVVACVSEEVADEVVRLGVDRGRVLVSPMAVDAERFSPAVSGAAVRERLGLDDAFVVGWTGSFRSFHGLDGTLDAFAKLRRKVPEAEAPPRRRRPRARRRRASARHRWGSATPSCSPVPTAHADLPPYLAAMDVDARDRADRATTSTTRRRRCASTSPWARRWWRPGSATSRAPSPTDVDGLLYDAGDDDDFVDACCSSSTTSRTALRERLGRAGSELMVRTGTWDARVAELANFPAFHGAL